MLNWLSALQAFLLPYGAWGVMGIAFVDSAFLPLPQAIDLWVITLCLRHPELMLLYTGAATLGSVAGCLVLYYIARKGGHLFLERKVGKTRAERIRNSFERYEFLTVMVPAMMPPPTPFKAFVITAGVLEVHLGKFLLALIVGRAIRFVGEGYLAVRYGHAVWHFMLRHGRMAALATVGAVLVAWLVGRVQARRRDQRAGSES